MSSTWALVVASALAYSPRPALRPRHVHAARLSPVRAYEPPPPAGAPSQSLLASLDFSDWDERETWALEDNVRKFCVDDGRFVLWRRLSIEVPELLQRSPKELRTRWLAMNAERGSTLAEWEDLPCLEEWHCVSPGRYHGELHGVSGMRDGSLTVTVEHDAEGASALGAANEVVDVYGEEWCVRTRTGELFQLGQRSLVADTEGPDAASGALAALGTMQLEEVPAAAAGVAGAAGQIVVPPLLMGGVVLAASAIGYMVLGHHHVDVSVFIV